MEIVKLKSFYFDETGQAVKEVDESTRKTLEADTVIFAVGQTPEGTDAMGLELTHGPYLKTTDNLACSEPGICRGCGHRDKDGH